MSLVLALIVLALLVAAVVALAAGPGWGEVRPTHPDAARLAAEQAAIRSRREDPTGVDPASWRPAA
jgi:hypothetical protein